MSDVIEPERWLPIAGLEGSYEVSDLGRVRSLSRIDTLPGGRQRPRQGRILKPSIGGSGYPIVSLPEPSARSGFRVRSIHALVAAAFLGPRPEGTEVRHLDGVRANCKLSNLAYGTRFENEADKRRHGTHEKTRRIACPLGHPLISPNLVLGALKRGGRNCRACGRARSTLRHAAKHGVSLDLKTEADRHYAAIMTTD